MDKERRILKIQNELVFYESLSSTPPYQFLNCTRGALNTTPETRAFIADYIKKGGH